MQGVFGLLDVLPDMVIDSLEVESRGTRAFDQGGECLVASHLVMKRLQADGESVVLGRVALLRLFI